MPPEVTIPQAKFLSLPQKIRAFVGGYGSGKTYVGCTGLCRFALKHPWVNQAYFGPTYSQIRDIFYPTIDEVAFTFGLNTDIKEGNKEVHVKHGHRRYCTIICRSMEKPNTIVGFKIGNALVDEIDVLPLNKAENAFKKILARLREKDVPNGVDFTSTPEGFKFIYKIFKEQLEVNEKFKESYGLVQASTYDNGKNLPPTYIPTLRAAYPAELVEAYINGQFVNLTSGTVYYAFDRRLHSSLHTIEPGEPIHIGMDFNVGKMAAKIFVIRARDEWHCVDEVVDAFDTPAIIKIIDQKYSGHQITVYPDSSGQSRKTTDASTSDIALLQGRYRVKFNPTNPLVKDRVMSVNKRFQDFKLFVNVLRCPKTASDLEQQSYDQNGVPDKSAGNDHGNDAFGYPIAYMYPIRKPIIDIKASYVN